MYSCIRVPWQLPGAWLSNRRDDICFVLEEYLTTDRFPSEAMCNTGVLADKPAWDL